MKIIKTGDEKSFRRTCVDCETTFEYTYQDTKINDIGSKYVNCPTCAATIVHGVKQLSKKRIIENEKLKNITTNPRSIDYGWGAF